MQIAFISDIHGNLTALEAVLKDIRLRNIQTINCLGDLIGKGPRGSECIQLVRENCDKVVTGNWDVFIQQPSDHEHIQWVQQTLSESDYTYLKGLPFSLDLELNEKLIRCFHASPRSVFERIYPDYHTKEQCLSLFENSEQTSSNQNSRTPDIVMYGDIHVQLLRNYDLKLLCNVGSVGLDYVEACYTILESKNGATSIQFVRAPYDREAELAAARGLQMVGYEAYEREIMYDEVLRQKEMQTLNK